MGRGYVIEHCISTLRFLNREEIYRGYVTEVIRHICSCVGYQIDTKYSDLVDYDTDSGPVEQADAQEIISNIKDKVALLQGSG